MRRLVTVNAIHTDQDARRALRRIETLWGAKLGTAQRDEFDVLIVLLEAHCHRARRCENVSTSSPFKGLFTGRFALVDQDCPRQRWPSRGQQMCRHAILTAQIWKEEDVFVSLCPELGVSSSGTRVASSLRDLQEAVGGFLACVDSQDIGERLRRQHDWDARTKGVVLRLPL